MIKAKDKPKGKTMRRMPDSKMAEPVMTPGRMMAMPEPMPLHRVPPMPDRKARKGK